MKQQKLSRRLTDHTRAERSWRSRIKSVQQLCLYRITIAATSRLAYLVWNFICYIHVYVYRVFQGEYDGLQWMERLFVNYQFKGMWVEVVVLIVRYFPSICVDWLWKTTGSSFRMPGLCAPIWTWWGFVRKKPECYQLKCYMQQNFFFLIWTPSMKRCVCVCVKLSVLHAPCLIRCESLNCCIRVSIFLCVWVC